MSSTSPDTTLHIYTRVSTVAQADKGTSLKSQLELGIKKAKELKFEYEHWDEGGKSSFHEDIAERPVLFELYRSIRTGLVKHLWVYDQSRISRNDQVASIFRYECNKQGVTLYTKDGQFDLSSPTDKLLKQMLDAVAEFDNATRAERTRLGKLHKVKAGYWHGGPAPFGYCLQDKRLVVDNDEAKWVKRIFDEAYRGVPSAEIKQLLDSNGVKARRGGLWSIGSIDALIKNTHYTGQYVYQDKKSEQQITVQCDQVVDASIWQTVQQMKKREGNRHEQKNRTTKNFYLLRDIMYCGHCGRPISGRISMAKGEAHYYCPNKERQWVEKGKSDTPWQRGTGCGFERSLNIFRADELVWGFVSQLHQQSSILKEELKRRILKAHGLGAQTSKVEARKIEAKIRKLQREVQAMSETLGNLEANRLMNKLGDTSYQTTVARIAQEKDRLELALSDARRELHGASETRKWVNWIDEFGKEVKDASQMTDEERKTYIEGLVERIDVKYLPETREHQLLMHFHLPIVGDGIKWLDPDKKSRGYEVLEGDREATLAVKKRDKRG